MENYNSIPAVCIVGRPNVGKSSLFNCLVGERRAVVVEQSGTTRDRVEAVISVSGADVKLIDTGGYMPRDRDELNLQVKEQIYGAMEEASVILFVVDTISGVSPLDREVGELLRKFSKNVILVANKADNDKLKDEALEFYQLGFGEPMPMACLHRRGLRALRKELEGAVKDVLEERGPVEEMGRDEGLSRPLKIAVVGRPNVGKSSFINSLLDMRRVIVSDIPGTTRDSIDTGFTYNGEDYVLIDTAGIRHKRKIKTTVDAYSVMRSRGSIDRADVVFLLLDASEGATRDDLGIMNLIDESGKACLLIVNKWDLAEAVQDVSREDYEKHLVYATGRLVKYPITFVSALTGKNVPDTLMAARVLDANLDLHVSTPFLNRIFERSDPGRVPIPRRKKRPNFLYVVQSGRRPVEFKFFVDDPRSVLPAHINFIENTLRDNLPLQGIPVKIEIRRSRKERK